MIAALVAAVALVLAFVAARAAVLERDADLRRDGVGGRRPPRAIPPAALSVGAMLAGAAVGSLLAGPIGVVILGIAGAILPSIVGRRRLAKRADVIERELLDLVVSMAATLRAGRSLEQALEVGGEEIDPPVGASVVAITDRVALGTTLDASIEIWSRDVGTAEARLIGGVLGLQRRTGGALAGPLDELAATLRARRTAARELRSLTAQARLSAGILGLLPIGFFLFLSTVSRHDIESAIATTPGAAAVTLGVVLQGSAFVWIRSLLRAGER